MKKIIEPFLQGGLVGVGMLFVVIVGGVTYAAWNDDVSNGDPLTATHWNELVSQVESISFPVGMIAPFGGSSCPTGWIAANGAILSSGTHPGLFSALGGTHGGNGTSTYAVPDLRGRTAVGYGAGPTLSSYALGQQEGVESRALAIANLPAHNHGATATLNARFVPPTGGGTYSNPNDAVLSANGDLMYSDQSPNVQMSSESIDVTIANQGSGASFDIRQPLVALNYCIYTGN